MTQSTDSSRKDETKPTRPIRREQANERPHTDPDATLDSRQREKRAREKTDEIPRKPRSNTDVAPANRTQARPHRPVPNADDQSTMPHRTVHRPPQPKPNDSPPPRRRPSAFHQPEPGPTGRPSPGTKPPQATMQRPPSNYRLPDDKLPTSPPPGATRRAPRNNQAVRWGWVLRRTMVTLLVLFGLGLGMLLGGSMLGYAWIASQLPAANELRSRSFQFATSQILDREGNLLYEIIDPTGGRRTNVRLDQISQDLIDATVATEDRFFYRPFNVGVDPIAIARAVYYNFSEGKIVSGASTITQQLARNVLLPEERSDQTLTRKLKEAVLAVEINRRYSKAEILEIYLNQIYYGNLAYGIEAAAQTYFGKSANALTLAEAAQLAGLPQAPAFHDPYVNPEQAKSRQSVVLNLMVEADYVTRSEAEEAKQIELSFRELNEAFDAPHFVNLVRQELETFIPPNLIYQEPGLRIRTTLDPRLQNLAETSVRENLDKLAGRNVNNAALVSLDVTTGQILALVGSRNFRDEEGGQINMATTPRQPGSTIKVLTYLAAFEQLSWTPSTLLMDVPVEYSDGAGGVYRPTNGDNRFHGPVSLRTALANSYNIPAVKTLAELGVPALQNIAARLGITTLNEGVFGLALTLGSGEIPLIEMTGAYQAVANQGVQLPATTILSISDGLGRAIAPLRANPRRVLRRQHAYLMTDILADNEARAPIFGTNSSLQLSRPAAVKTGTTNDYRDSWIVGYTPGIVTGVWVGNNDLSPMNGIGGSSGAGLIWNQFMEQAHAGLPLTDFSRPDNIVELEICRDSGTQPSEMCPERTTEIFYSEQLPPPPEADIHQLIEIDLNSELRANEFCQANVETRYYRVYPPDGREWAISQGLEQPPEDYCPSSNIIARLLTPDDGAAILGQLAVEGVATAAQFAEYRLELGQGPEPQGFFETIHGPVFQPVERGVLGVLDTTRIENGLYTLRLAVRDRNGGATYDTRLVRVDNPQPSATASPSPTQTPPATGTPAPTTTPAPTGTPTATPFLATATATPSPSPTATLFNATATATLLPVTATLPPATNTPTLSPATNTPTLSPATNTPTLSPATNTPIPTATLLPNETATTPPEPLPTEVGGE